MNIDNRKFQIKKGQLIEDGEKNYNPFKAFFNFYKDMSSGDSVISNFKKNYNDYIEKMEKKKISDQIANEARKKIQILKEKESYSNEELNQKYQEIYNQIKSENPAIQMQKASLVEEVISGGKAAGKTGFETGSKVMKVVSQGIGEKIYSMTESLPVPGVADKVGSWLGKIGFDKEKMKPKPVALFSASGEINKEAFYDENRKGYTDFAKDVFISKPAGILFKTFASGAVAGIFVTVLGPIGFIPAIGLQAVGFKSTFESIVIEIPEELFMLISTTMLNGFKEYDKIPESIQIELAGEEIFVKDQDGIIIGSSFVTPEQKSQFEKLNNDIEVATESINQNNLSEKNEASKKFDEKKPFYNKNVDEAVNNFVESYKSLKKQEDLNLSDLKNIKDPNELLKKFLEGANKSSGPGHGR